MRTVALPAEEILTEVVDDVIRPRWGIAAHFFDVKRLLDSVMDDYFSSPDRRLRVDPVTVLVEAGIPSDISALAVDQLKTRLYTSVQESFEIIYPGKDYYFTITPTLELVITEF